ncbi:hypothetical protein Bbelb_433720 [Branchiostoma belcheri]|nr:hypothetical protein Bbelb_445170 [Branchiostoma belcheri]KAI8478907.1 hypothetical protein Bbelb_433720 [Branchiostoma belcheri]
MYRRNQHIVVADSTIGGNNNNLLPKWASSHRRLAPGKIYEGSGRWGRVGVCWRVTATTSLEARPSIVGLQENGNEARRPPTRARHRPKHRSLSVIGPAAIPQVCSADDVTDDADVPALRQLFCDSPCRPLASSAGSTSTAEPQRPEI